MNIKDSIHGIVKLRSSIKSFPEGGLATAKHRVELAEKDKPGDGWISELTVFGELPWKEGEERHVEVRILSKNFREYVIDHKPSLLVKRGNELVGEIQFVGTARHPH